MCPSYCPSSLTNEFTACPDFSSASLTVTVTASAPQLRQDSCYQNQSGECGAARTSSGRPPALITPPTLIPPVLPGPGGHRLMSFGEEIGVVVGAACCVRDERCIRITDAHRTQTHLTTTAPSRPPFSFSYRWARPYPPLLSNQTNTPSLLPSIPQGRPTPPREIPEQCWNMLLSPRSQCNCWVIPVYSSVLRPACESEEKKKKKKGGVLFWRPSVTVIETTVHEQTRSTKKFTTCSKASRISRS